MSSIVTGSYQTGIGLNNLFASMNTNARFSVGSYLDCHNLSRDPIIYTAPQSKLERMMETLTDNQKNNREYVMYKMVYGDINIKERKNELMRLFLEPIAVQLAYYEYDSYIHKFNSSNNVNGTIAIGVEAYPTKSNQMVFALDKGTKALKTSLKVVPVDNPTPVESKLMLIAYMEIIVNGEFYKLPLYQ
jgi:hypothetical protein